MPSIGHLAVGLAVARGVRRPERLRPLAWTAACLALAELPDLDVVAFRLGVPYGAPWGHRGAVHSLAFAAACTVAAALLARAGRLPVGRMALAAALGLVSHDLLDTLTDGGMGIALLWPFSARRLFAPWQPIPVAPIGLRVFTARGLSVMLREALIFAPLFVYGSWPRRAPAAPSHPVV
jgi:inner membrane protein